jgi:hypothetical protein
MILRLATLAFLLLVWGAVTLSLAGCTNGFGENIDPFPADERLD